MYNIKYNLQAGKFTDELNAWSHKNLISNDDLDKVTLFGDITLTNWKYDDLRLISKPLPFAVIENETRTTKLADTLQKFISIVLDKGILMNKFWTTNNPDTINLKMNNSDFDNYKNKTFYDTINYLDSNIKTLALNENAIKTNDYFNLKGLNTETFEQKILNEHFTKNKYQISIDKKAHDIVYLNINGINCIIPLSGNTYSVEQGENDNVWS
ncbi:hypothetical protein [Spiroplasma endosymbiont of Nebria brevicollis]|uniref:hypothetical protein n=1 Tax=Spiroplasma endosymbiont of Nebria brevicollis TaxID=3066284 RepID=UPI00313C2EA5